MNLLLSDRCINNNIIINYKMDIFNNKSNSISTMSEISQAELDKLILTPEAKAHYSQENEIKRLIIERETYKRAYELQQENINKFVNKLNNIMSPQVKFDYSKMSRFKVENKIEYFKNFLLY